MISRKDLILLSNKFSHQEIDPEFLWLYRHLKDDVDKFIISYYICFLDNLQNEKYNKIFTLFVDHVGISTEKQKFIKKIKQIRDLVDVYKSSKERNDFIALANLKIGKLNKKDGDIWA